MRQAREEISEPPEKIGEPTATTGRDADIAGGLFVDDRELRRRLNPKLGWDRFRATIRTAEATPSPNGRDFPKTSALWGGRYWPAVVAYLDDVNKVHTDELGSSTDDGPEDFDAATRTTPRLQARPPRPALLDRATTGARPDGLPASVRRFAPRS
jgi:hypothetical protein